jgi:hypothetical protein
VNADVDVDVDVDADADADVRVRPRIGKRLTLIFVLSVANITVLCLYSIGMYWIV